MVDYRTLLAAVLGVGLGVVLVAAPEFVVQVHSVGRRPDRQRGEYGGQEELSDRVRRLVQVVGVGLIVLGGYFGYTVVG